MLFRRPSATPPPIEQWQQRFQSTGLLLREHRESLGLSLEELARLTRIQRRQLWAIEEGRSESLPERVYIQGMVRRYADALGLDGQQYADELRALIALPISRSDRPSDQPLGRLRTWQWYLLYLLFVLLAINGLSWLMRRAALQGVNLQQPIPALPVEEFLPPPAPAPRPPQQQAQPLDAAPANLTEQLRQIPTTSAPVQ
ncbi:helix-turn-helix domain-containing protein [Synechococcus elongatus]|uniref:Transcriptional regulator, XRE family n=2 Tax=Synechococcus elongatus TaxID=32046 RepID=Q31PI0_SYNE7|nr:helix-turn-helix domain-containing protein [Synechococcus elongatus]ABB57039.1 transcriptional regulator, XRE family [Synechococcus elongatus PCC 7942 = FACHB-805]AJD58440.1 hypothetical protein M744_11650 [Synechococcus elongatus UTEX 2973]MBD2587441.1 helix-turn-helix domain-containing protein [Synechococcus elongatus FACHB-242]MBD2688780.1 helix-turn-helix domain-containing protein [Synechococcus elongatus FACHB-1061]MBD2707851.1 helix-turn-helix domain-containing protein [Synechococcus 